MIFKFSNKIVKKEWKNLALPFLSVLLTATVVSTSFLLIGSASDYLIQKNKEFLGGDISYEANSDISTVVNSGKLIDKNLVSQISNQITFSGILTTKNSTTTENPKTSTASFKIVDNNYPLYGELKLQNEKYEYLKEGEIYIDETIAKNLNLVPGDILNFNDTDFVVKDIILEDPESLLSGFNFSGKVILSTPAINYSKIDLQLFRKEYISNLKLNKNLNKAEVDVLRQNARNENIRGRFDASQQGGFQQGLEVVERFLIVTLLIISILSLVNIYASVNYLANRLRRSFAILISIGMNIKSVYKILFLVNLFVIIFGTFIGLIFSYFLTNYITMLVSSNFGLDLIIKINYQELLFIYFGILLTSIFATVPVLNRLRKINPRELLSHSESGQNKNTTKNIFVDVIIGILPIALVSIYFLDSILYGLLSVALIVVTYGLIMFLYNYFVKFIYSKRDKFNFSIRMIIAQKKFDGFFGLITFASLFVALAAVYNLSIIRSSIDDYLKKDLQRNLPSVYVLDVQNSQVEGLQNNFQGMTLFPNVRARISQIDSLDIQKAIEERYPNIDRELGREFNLTFRDYLLPSEEVESGTFSPQNVGEVSVEKDFATRANIKLGSNINFLIQGFTVEAKVTSIRTVDTRSGYPFFYFILSEQDIGEYPKTYFGYTNFTNENAGESEENQKNIDTLSVYLAENAPNVTVINTGSITKIAETLIDFLLIIILIITVPPLVLSSLLIVTILSTLSKERKRDGARLMAIGKTHHFVRNYYIIESTMTTVFASGFAYIFALLVSNFLIIKYLKIDSLVYFDIVSFFIFIFILLGIVVVSVISWVSGRQSLREYLNYEENN